MDKTRRAQNALPGSLGELELKVMEAIWAQPGIDARSITESLAEEAPTRLSSVQATLERLLRKNFLARRKQGHAYLYTALKSRSDLLGTLLKDVIKLLHDGHTNTILSSFVNVAERLEESALDELESMIRRKRMEQEKSDD